jgi:hypothetical protein
LESYQQRLVQDKYANLAIEIGHKYHKDHKWIHKSSLALIVEEQRYKETKSKDMTEDHMRQFLVKLTKEV